MSNNQLAYVVVLDMEFHKGQFLDLCYSWYNILMFLFFIWLDTKTYLHQTHLNTQLHTGEVNKEILTICLEL